MNPRHLKQECLEAERIFTRKVIDELLPNIRRYQVSPSRENLTSFARSLAETYCCVRDVGGSFDLPLLALVDAVDSGTAPETDRCSEIMMEHMTKREMGERYTQKGYVL